MKITSHFQSLHANFSPRHGFNPIRTLNPESLTRQLDAFHRGDLGPAALLWDAMERCDDLLKGVAAKRKKSIARLPWEILTVDDSPEAQRQQEALRFFYNNIRCTNAVDRNECGSMSLLIKQMMDAVAKKYAVHEIIYRTHESCSVDGLEKSLLSAEFRFVPLWFFENHTGKLRFLPSECDRDGIPLEEGAWLTTVGEGLMEPCSIAYLFKHLPLRDWLIYCERNGMPGVKGITDAFPGTPQWEAALHAVESFGAEFNALLSAGSDLQAIDLASRGELPYPGLIERMDRSMAALWCGCDLSTLSRSHSVGASCQVNEHELLQQDDALAISETLNEQVDRYVLKHLFGSQPVKAYVSLRIQPTRNIMQELEICERLQKMGINIPKNDLCERFGIRQNTSLLRKKTN
jgi:phage gp29-like protein